MQEIGYPAWPLPGLRTFRVVPVKNAVVVATVAKSNRPDWFDCADPADDRRDPKAKRDFNAPHYWRLTPKRHSVTSGSRKWPTTSEQRTTPIGSWVKKATL